MPENQPDKSHKTGRGSSQFVLRMPDGLRDRIKTNAEQNRRSMNSEIILHLEHALANTQQPQGAGGVWTEPHNGSPIRPQNECSTSKGAAQ